MAAGTAAAETKESEETVELRWALGATGADDSKPSAIERDSELTAGTKLKFLVEPLSSGSVYLILLDSQDDIHVLYRESADAYSDPAYIPPGRGYLVLDDEKGRETFFLLASAEPLEGLDGLLADYDDAEGGSREKLGEAIVAEIRRVNKENRQFSRPVEKPVMIGGQTRADTTPESEIDRLAVQISAQRFYGKTITIDH
jgi:hypothetical protein